MFHYKFKQFLFLQMTSFVLYLDLPHFQNCDALMVDTFDFLWVSCDHIMVGHYIFLCFAWYLSANYMQSFQV